MKKKFWLLALIFLPVALMNAQTWKYQSGGNDFDGKFKTSSIKGIGNDYPYNSPILVLNKFDKLNSFNFYIGKAGYFPDEYGNEILWVFSNEKDVIYETIDYSISDDKESIFLKEFKSPKSGEILSIYEFLLKLKSASSVSVRVKDKRGKNDLKFSLSGSTKAIGYVIPQKEFEEVIENAKLIRKVTEEKNRTRDSILNSIKVVKMKLKPISSNPSLAVKKISRENLVGQRVKFLVKKKKNDYISMGKDKNAYPFLKYSDYAGKTATIVGLEKTDSSKIKYIYKLEIEDTKEIVFWKVMDYSEFESQIGIFSLLEEARKKYIGKTFYNDKYRSSSDDLNKLQECKITKITFAEDDGKYSQLYGAFNVYYETKGFYSKYSGFESETKIEKMINVIFTDTYAPTEGYKYSHNKEKVFENIFYYLKD